MTFKLKYDQAETESNVLADAERHCDEKGIKIYDEEKGVYIKEISVEYQGKEGGKHTYQITA